VADNLADDIWGVRLPYGTQHSCGSFDAAALLQHFITRTTCNDSHTGPVVRRLSPFLAITRD